MNEAGSWTALKGRLDALGLDPHRVENALGNGTPDVTYTAGWVELKWLEAWPARSTTPVRLRKLEERPAQVAWLTRRWAAGGPAWLALRVAKELLVFSGRDVRAVRDGLLRAELRDLACWATSMTGYASDDDWRQLGAVLRWDDEAMWPHHRARVLRLRCGCSPSHLAAELGPGWVEHRVIEAELSTVGDTNTLIDHWVA